MLLSNLCDRLALSRGIAPDSARQYLAAVRGFSRFLGHEPRLPDLSADTVNRWLAATGDTLAPATLRNRRTHLLALWRFAADEGLCAFPRKIRPVRAPLALPIAWSADEVRRLLSVSQSLGIRGFAAWT